MANCVVCGSEYEKPYLGRVCCKSCFNAEYWLDRIDRYNNDTNVIVVNGIFYYDGGYKENVSPFTDLGNGGAIVKIRMNDGTERMTNNLWHNGTIPEKFKRYMQDNATFIH